MLLFTSVEHLGERSVYTVGDATFNYLGTTVDFITETMRSVGFCEISVDKYEYPLEPGFVADIFIKATKAMQSDAD